MGEMIKMFQTDMPGGEMIFKTKHGEQKIPISVFAQIEDGELDLTEIDNWKEIVIEIIHDWLCYALNDEDQPVQ